MKNEKSKLSLLSKFGYIFGIFIITVFSLWNYILSIAILIVDKNTIYMLSSIEPLALTMMGVYIIIDMINKLKGHGE